MCLSQDELTAIILSYNIKPNRKTVYPDTSIFIQLLTLRRFNCDPKSPHPLYRLLLIRILTRNFASAIPKNSRGRVWTDRWRGRLIPEYFSNPSVCRPGNSEYCIALRQLGPLKAFHFSCILNLVKFFVSYYFHGRIKMWTNGQT